MWKTIGQTFQIIIREKNKAKTKPINQKKEETHQPNMIHGLRLQLNSNIQSIKRLKGDQENVTLVGYLMILKKYRCCFFRRKVVLQQC